MLQLIQEYQSGGARLRFDVYGPAPVETILEDTSFLNYRLAAVTVGDATLATADVVWHQDEPVKDIRYEFGRLTLDGVWLEGEIQRVIVAMLALRMEAVGLHPSHSSAVRYCGKTIMFLGGESNHGKTMAQIEGCRRGGQVVSTETTVLDERGWAVMGSKNVFLRKRAKGTERADLPNQDQGVAKFFDKTPEFVNYYEPCDVDLVILPAMDGHFDTAVTPMIPFEREYQTFHSLVNYFGLGYLLAPALAMPLIDSDTLRRRRADWCHRFAVRPCYMIRARTPQLLMDEVDKVM